jgi:hypothetical protein
MTSTKDESGNVTWHTAGSGIMPSVYSGQGNYPYAGTTTDTYGNPAFWTKMAAGQIGQYSYDLPSLYSVIGGISVLLISSRAATGPLYYVLDSQSGGGLKPDGIHYYTSSNDAVEMDAVAEWDGLLGEGIWDLFLYDPYVLQALCVRPAFYGPDGNTLLTKPDWLGFENVDATHCLELSGLTGGSLNGVPASSNGYATFALIELEIDGPNGYIDQDGCGNYMRPVTNGATVNSNVPPYFAIPQFIFKTTVVIPHSQTAVLKFKPSSSVDGSGNPLLPEYTVFGVRTDLCQCCFFTN